MFCKKKRNTCEKKMICKRTLSAAGLVSDDVEGTIAKQKSDPMSYHGHEVRQGPDHQLTKALGPVRKGTRSGLRLLAV